MSDLVEDFLAREKDGLAGLEDEIPQAFQGGILGTREKNRFFAFSLLKIFIDCKFFFVNF